MNKDLVSYIKKRITHAEKRASALEEDHGDKPEQTQTYFGGWSLGYWEGRLAALDDILFKIDNGDESSIS